MFGKSDSFNKNTGASEDELWMFASKNPSYESLEEAIKNSTSMSEVSLFYAEKAFKIISLDYHQALRLETLTKSKASKFSMRQGWGDGGYLKVLDLLNRKRAIAQSK